MKYKKIGLFLIMLTFSIIASADVFVDTNVNRNGTDDQVYYRNDLDRNQYNNNFSSPVLDNAYPARDVNFGDQNTVVRVRR